MIRAAVAVLLVANFAADCAPGADGCTADTALTEVESMKVKLLQKHNAAVLKYQHDTESLEPSKHVTSEPKELAALESPAAAAEFIRQATNASVPDWMEDFYEQIEHVGVAFAAWLTQAACQTSKSFNERGWGGPDSREKADKDDKCIQAVMHACGDPTDSCNLFIDCLHNRMIGSSNDKVDKCARLTMDVAYNAVSVLVSSSAPMSIANLAFASKCLVEEAYNCGNALSKEDADAMLKDALKHRTDVSVETLNKGIAQYARAEMIWNGWRMPLKGNYHPEKSPSKKWFCGQLDDFGSFFLQTTLLDNGNLDLTVRNEEFDKPGSVQVRLNNEFLAQCNQGTCTFRIPKEGSYKPGDVLGLHAVGEAVLCIRSIARTVNTQAVHMRVTGYGDSILTNPVPCGSGQMVATQKGPYGTDSDCEAYDQCVIDVNSACQVKVWLRDRCASVRHNYVWSGLTSDTASSGSCQLQVAQT